MRRFWNSAIHSLVMIRLGQELGTDSDLAQSIAHSIDYAIRLVSALVG